MNFLSPIARPDDTLLVTCRSGDRGAMAVNQLAKAGFKNVYNSQRCCRTAWYAMTHMRCKTPTVCVKIVLLAILCMSQTLADSARAADSSEFWPEVSAFVGLSPRTRVYLDATYAQGKESDAESLDLAAYLDISIKPIFRTELLSEDWQRSRYLWARIGYDRIFKTTGDTPAYVAEDRGIVSLYAKAPLPAEVWLEARVRADLRWIDGDYSTRYRFRLEATREFTVRNHTVVPYFNVEWFYDTRYDAWARILYQVGTEVTVNQHFRYEIYLARQDDGLPSKESLNALGVVAKWYY